MIEENILKINKDLPPQTRLIAVSKTKPVEMRWKCATNTRLCPKT